MTKYLLEAREGECTNFWDLVWYDDETDKITRESIEEEK